MSFVTLSATVRDIHALAQRTPPPKGLDVRMRAAWLALRREGENVSPTSVNVAALADQMRDRLVVHLLRPAIGELVRDTDLHSLPSEPPPLLRRSWLVESRHAERGEALFGTTVALGGYSLDGAIYLVGLDYPDGCRVGVWRPSWDGGELERGVTSEASPLIDDVQDHAAWTRAAARFAIVLGLLLDAESAPIRVREERETARRAGARKAKPDGWTMRYVTLGESPPESAGAGATVGGNTPIDGRVALDSQVRGHLKRQRHGPANALTKYVYIAGYSARRWVSPTPARIVVGTR